MKSSTRRDESAVIKCIGVGGCGGSAVEHMIERIRRGVHLRQYRCAGAQTPTARTQLQLGSTPAGLARAPSRSAADAAMEDRDRIAETDHRRRHAVHHAGMGGGTGTGGPVIADIAESSGVIRAGVTRPFSSRASGRRSRRRHRGAQQEVVRDHDPNDNDRRLGRGHAARIPMRANDRLRRRVRIAEVISKSARQRRSSPMSAP